MFQKVGLFQCTHELRLDHLLARTSQYVIRRASKVNGDVPGQHILLMTSHCTRLFILLGIITAKQIVQDT